MKAPGFLRTALLVAGKDLRQERRTGETLVSSFVFALVVLVICSLAFDVTRLEGNAEATLLAAVLWVAIAFATVVGTSRSMQIEERQGTWTALFLAPVDRGGLFTGKLIANTLKLLLLEALLLPAGALFFGAGLGDEWPALALVLTLHGLGLAVLGTLLSGVAVRVGRGEALAAILLLPAATPILLSAVSTTRGVLTGTGLADVRSWLLFQTGFDVLYYLIALVVFEFVMEE